MEILINKVESFNNYSIEVNRWCRKNRIKIPRAIRYNLNKIKKLFLNLMSKYRYKQDDLASTIDEKHSIWLYKQLTLFHWSVISLGVTNSINIDEFVNFSFYLLERKYFLILSFNFSFEINIRFEILIQIYGS